MTGVQGRPKGSKGEIEVAKIIEPWWAAFEPLAPDGHPIRFVRTPLSGGWGGKDTRSGFRASGDLMTTAAKFPFSIEVKRREGWKWDPLLKGRRSPVWGYWQQAVGQGLEMRATPLLWLRHNREPWAVMLPFVVLRKKVEVVTPLGPGRVILYDVDGKPKPVSHVSLTVTTARAPIDRMPGAMRLWTPSELAAVNYAKVLPALVSAKSFLGVPPEVWDQACREASAE